jgi:hypothetical protein
VSLLARSTHRRPSGWASRISRPIGVSTSTSCASRFSRTPQTPSMRGGSREEDEDEEEAGDEEEGKARSAGRVGRRRLGNACCSALRGPPTAGIALQRGRAALLGGRGRRLWRVRCAPAAATCAPRPCRCCAALRRGRARGRCSIGAAPRGGAPHRRRLNLRDPTRPPVRRGKQL